jgi:hypothetical protein
LKPETDKSLRSGFLDRNKNITGRRDDPARCACYQWATFSTIALIAT